MKKPKILWYLAMLTTFQQRYAADYGFQRVTTCKLGVGDSDGSVNSLDGVQRTDQCNHEDAQWNATVERLWYAWRAIAPISALLLQLNIALMMIVGYIAIVAVFFSAASFASATLFSTFKENMKCGSKKERWIKATEHPRETDSVDFWTTLSLPLTFLVWSVLLSLAIILAYVVPGQQPSRQPVAVGIFSGVIMILALLVFAGQYRVVVFIREVGSGPDV